MTPLAHPVSVTVDVEETWHAELVRKRGLARGVARSPAQTRAVLELLHAHGARATFFVVGAVAERSPELLGAIAAAGHEIGFHGWSHRPLAEVGVREFEAELVRFDELVRAQVGPDVRVRGFRAPTFSLDAASAWALPVLASHGYTYDASVFPLRTPLYGIAGAPLGAYRPRLDAPGRHDPHAPIVEVPPAVLELGRLRIPVGGGIYLRALPALVTEWALRRIAERRAVVLYVHPWELDTGAPRLALPLLARLATYGGVCGARKKLDALLAAFGSIPLSEAVS